MYRADTLNLKHVTTQTHHTERVNYTEDTTSEQTMQSALIKKNTLYTYTNTLQSGLIKYNSLSTQTDNAKWLN